MSLVRLEMRSRGFKASILLLISASWDSWDFLDQRVASIDDYRRKNDGVSKNEGYSPLFIVLKTLGGQGNLVAKMWRSLVVPRLMWSKKKRCGSLGDQDLDCGACKQLRGEVGASLRCLDCMVGV
ncbi:hypothetical protein Tco_0929554 [Tanacetum coccineum]